MGSLCVSVLPDASSDRRPPSLYGHPGTDAVPQAQLVEGQEYRYEFRDLAVGQDAEVSTDHPEIFQRSTSAGISGRLRPGLYVGSLDVGVTVDGVLAGVVSLEVRSRKLAYESEYRWMLRDLSESAAEIVQSAFSPSSWQFGADPTQDSKTLYQRFAFLRGMLCSDVLSTAFDQVLNQPYRIWLADHESRRPGLGSPGSSRVARHLAGPGPRMATSRAPLQLSSVPIRIKVPLHHSSLDNPANRFVKFALTQWLQTVRAVHDRLQALDDRPSVRRGLGEALEVAGRLEAWLSSSVLSEVSELSGFPRSDQVLEKREGYRDVYRIFLLSQVAASLSWPGGSDTVYSAGKRDVATLYEYWTYLELAKVVSRQCDVPLDLSSLVRETQGGLELDLRRGRHHVLTGEVVRFGRRLCVELWFNRTFSALGAGAAWTRGMRPDCSLRVSGLETDQEIWIHFDAKYRVDGLVELMGRAASDVSEEERQLSTDSEYQDRELRSTRSDLLKMHAYKDAIRRSGGAYVLFPGGEEGEIFWEYREILPGLGAFPLRPSSHGDAHGAGTLSRFLSDILDHLASRLTQHERARYWQGEAYSADSPAGLHGPALIGLRQPAADTPALLGYVKSQAHADWILAEGLYNLRADGRTGSVGLAGAEIGAEILVLYGPSLAGPLAYAVVGEPRVLSRANLMATGYPEPRGAVYLVLPLRRLPSEIDLSNRVVRRLLDEGEATPTGNPRVVTWLSLLEAAMADATV